MNDTQSTAAVVLTGADRHRILADLWAVTGLGDHITEIVVDRGDMSCVQLDTDAHVTPLLIARDLLDNAREPHANNGTLHQFGTYRGVDLLFTVDYGSSDYRQGTYKERRAAAAPIAKAALADLKAAIAAGGKS